MSRRHTPEPIYLNDENPFESDYFPTWKIIALILILLPFYAFGSVRAWFANPIHQDLFACLLMGLVGSWILIYGFCILVTL